MAPSDLLPSISPCRFWPCVPEQGVPQLLADADFFYLRQFSSLHILVHSFKEETEVNKQSVLLTYFLEDVSFSFYTFGSVLSFHFNWLWSTRAPLGPPQGSGDAQRHSNRPASALRWRRPSEVISVMYVFCNERNNPTLYVIYIHDTLV